MQFVFSSSVMVSGDGVLRYVGDEMMGMLVLLTVTYVGLIELVRSVIGLRGREKIIVMRYAVKLRMPLVSVTMTLISIYN